MSDGKGHQAGPLKTVTPNNKGGERVKTTRRKIDANRTKSGGINRPLNSKGK
jgi:hypothetical protein